MSNYLFDTRPLNVYISQRGRDAVNIVDGLSPDEILSKPVDDLASIVIKQTEIAIPTLIREQEVLSDPKEMTILMNDYGRSIHVPAIRLTLTIPFEGSAGFFDFQPNTSRSVPPEGEVSGQRLVLTVTTRSMDGNEVKATFEKNISAIQDYLRWQREMAIPHNANIIKQTPIWIQDRKTKLLEARNMAASIGYNMKPVLPHPSTHRAVQIQRKPTPVGAKTPTYKSEPELLEADYQHILGIIEAMSHVFERDPQAFANLGEEDLRQHILVPLNGHYRGEGMAEAFNNKGKTDILIRVEDKNIFIAECKVWSGAKASGQAIDQLLGYLTWRDTKTCLIMFSHLKDFTHMLNEFWISIESHPNFKRAVKTESETRRRYIFRNAYDPDRELILTGLAFNIPKI